MDGLGRENGKTRGNAQIEAVKETGGWRKGKKMQGGQKMRSEDRGKERKKDTFLGEWTRRKRRRSEGEGD
jgi:hypothetical protein